MTDLIHVITIWLSVTFGLPAAPNIPDVQQLPPDQIATMRYGDSVKGGHDVEAVYDPSTQTIILRHDWDSRSVAAVSVLVHEMVHHLQYSASLHFQCAGEREELAYTAQQRWLQLFGQDLESTFNIDAMTLKLRTSCLH